MGILSVGDPTSLSSTKCETSPWRIAESLNKTYERILKEIKKLDRALAL